MDISWSSIRRTTWRSLAAADNLRIPGEVGRAAGVRGGVGEMMRREGLNSAAMPDWRLQRDAGAVEAPGSIKRGPKPAGANPLAGGLALAQRDNLRLKQRPARAKAIIDPQKRSGLAGAAAGERREIMMDAVAALAPRRGLIRAACAAPGLSRASLHRRKALQKHRPAMGA